MVWLDVTSYRPTPSALPPSSAICLRFERCSSSSLEIEEFIRQLIVSGGRTAEQLVAHLSAGSRSPGTTCFQYFLFIQIGGRLSDGRISRTPEDEDSLSPSYS